MIDLRADHREAVRSRIIEAVHLVLVEEHPATISMPQVAARAGVSLRTLYRYFPTKGALVDAASGTFAAEPAAAVGGRPTVGTLSTYLGVAWRRFTQERAAVLAQHMTPAGREIRARRIPGNRAMVRAGLAEAGVDLPEDDLARLVDLLVALASSSTYLELVDRLGHDEDEAAAMAAWAATALIERARRDGGVPG